MTEANPGDRVLLPASGTGHPDHRSGQEAPIGPLAFLGVTVASFGGPLALAALYAPTIVTDTGGSAGLVTVGAAVVFCVPLVVWLRYARHVSTSGGLYGFAVAAVGRRVGLVQAALWTVSYLLYLVYTTAAVVYETLPAVLPGVRVYRPVLEVLLPIALATILLAGRAVTLAVLGALAAGQLVLVGVLAAVTVGHDAPAASFTAHQPAASLATATGFVALLYVCGSLPLFLGGEVARPTRTVRRGLITGYALTAGGVVAAVFPIAANPAFTHAPIPGMSMARVFSGTSLAVAVGLGVAASTTGVMLVEYLALTRLLHAVTGRSTRSMARVIAVPLVLAGPVSLIDPDGFYEALLKPSLIALWLSQLIVVAAYPWFAARHGRLRPADVLLASAAVAFTVFGMYATIQHAAS